MMIDNFISDLKDLYIGLYNGDRAFLDISNFKENWNVKNSIGEVYQNLSKKELKKDMGSFYTPLEIVKYITGEILSNFDYKMNPKVKILDPSCGGGYFLSQVYKGLKEKADILGIENAEEHILKYNIFGCDTDENAVMISKIEFYELTGHIADNIVVKDFLTEFDGEFDIIIGNPPYMGHKILTGAYRERLYEAFKEVFFDKADLSYCFIKKSIDLLKENGRLSFFTSRYLLEALNGSGVRSYLLEKGVINKLIDFYGVRVVKGAGVDTVIFDFIKGMEKGDIDFYRLNESANGLGEHLFQYINVNSSIYAYNTKVDFKTLKPSGFVFLSDLEKDILHRINGIELKDICESYQGIITGCDKAFVISNVEAMSLALEEALLKPWIKGKNINSFKVTSCERLLIYSDLITDESSYPNSIKFIKNYYNKLIGRRECKKGVRRWYDLQWGRNIDLFINKKIIYPYKASANRFALDEGNFFSADVYAIKIKKSYEKVMTYEYLVGLLNSSLYEFYIKSIAKKLGNNLYEYYPNKIMTLRIPEYIDEIDTEVRKGGEDLRDRIDGILYSHFNLSEDEINVIRKWTVKN